MQNMGGRDDIGRRRHRRRGAIGGAIARRCATPVTPSPSSTARASPPIDLGRPRAGPRRRRGSAARPTVAATCSSTPPRRSTGHRSPRWTWRRGGACRRSTSNPPLWLAQALVPGMTSRGFGRIVFIVSDTVWDPPAGDPPADDLLAYVASKAALIGTARTLARSLGRSGITVNCVAPGLTPTPAATADTPKEVFASVRARQAIGRDLSPDDIGAHGRLSRLAGGRARSPGRRSAPTAVWFCVELALRPRSDRSRSGRSGSRRAPDLLQPPEVRSSLRKRSGRRVKSVSPR